MRGKLKNIIGKYLSNSCTQEELDFLKEYLKSNDLNEFEKILKDDWNSHNTDEVPPEKENEIWLKLEGILADQKNVKRLANERVKRKLPFLKYAAIFIGIIVSATIFYTYNTSNQQLDVNQVTIELDDGTKKIINQTTKEIQLTKLDGKIVALQKESKLLYNDIGNAEDNGDKLVFNTLNVPYGKKFQIVLSDGSEVYLNSGSSLKYPVKFIKGTIREVYLEGEGYFSIAKNKNDSFIVNANTISTKVFGTQFNISSYDNEEFVKVVLVEGSVAVYDSVSKTNPNYLTPNQMASYLKSEKNIITDQVDISSHIAWKDGVLLFKNETFSNIARKLERHYNIKVVNNYKALDAQKFTGRFESENIDDVLETFKMTVNFNYNIDKNEIIINP